MVYLHFNKQVLQLSLMCVSQVLVFAVRPLIKPNINYVDDNIDDHTNHISSVSGTVALFNQND